jgi:hypothetical protein
MDGVYKTVAGYSVRILCTDSGINGYPVVAIIGHSDGLTEVETFTSDGEVFKGGIDSRDLVEITIDVEEREEV